MEKIARSVVRHRKLVLVIAVLLLIPSLFGAIGTHVNYDILTYLPDDLESKIGEEYLDEDFHMAATTMVVVENMKTSDILKLKDELSAVEGVSDVLWTSDFTDGTIPQEMLPEDLAEFFYSDTGATMMIVRFENASADEVTMTAQRKIKNIIAADTFIGGMSTILEDTRNLVNEELPMYILIAVGASLLVLYLSLKETVIPILFMVGMIFPIAYNFGTNYFLGEISYITEALATVLQLGVTMDFSIFLLHRFEEERENGMDDETAMVRAIVKTFSSISASSLTTIAGFLALCTMRLTLGRDIGIVMAKGVFLGVICTLIILPALIMTFRRAIQKYTHRTFIPKLTKTAGFVVRHRGAILAIFLVALVPFVFAQAKTPVYYTITDSLPQTLPGIEGTNKLKDDFGMATSHFVLVDENLSEKDLHSLTDEMSAVDGVHQVLSYESFLGAGIPESFIPEEISEIFEAGGHRMILVNSSYKSGTDELNDQLTELNDIVKKYDANGVITGEGAMTKDLIEVADTDFSNVNVTSIIVVFAIIAITFKSISIPVLLVAAIESAIMINLGIPYFTGTVLPFIASIVIGTIQLGATVDYAILMTTRYREELNLGHAPSEACRIAIEQCSQSILTSGLTFFAATFSVSLVSQMELLSSLCRLISRGAILSMAVILLVLPSLLIICEPIIRRTTYHWIDPKDVKKDVKGDNLEKNTEDHRGLPGHFPA